MNCYRCNATEELSAKKMNRDGTITFICRSCRREAYHKTKRPSERFKPVDKNWIAIAKEKNARIAEKYRDNAYLQAKGLL